MVTSKLVSWVDVSPWVGLIISAATILIAFALRYFAPIDLRYVTFYPALMVCTFFGGALVGCISLFICSALALYFFVPPTETFLLTSRVELYGLFFFCVVGGLIVAAIYVLRTALIRLAERQRESDAAKEEIAVLMQELLHRTKNDYSVITAIVRGVTARYPGGKAISEEVAEHLRSLAISHDLLLGSPGKETAMQALAHAELELFCGVGRFVARGDSISLSSNAARYIGLAIHELCTNSGKHGAICHEGQVEMWWAVSSGRFELNWRETGAANVEAPQHSGFGRTLLERLVPKALEGQAQLLFTPSGVHWRLVAPLSAVRG